jgi:SAM-dependent methyltransferase
MIAAMEAQELEQRIAAFPRWHYPFTFDNGVATPIPHRAMVNRQEQRRRYFFERLLALAGGSLRGRRVLDMGCNAGFFSLLAIEAGADYVLGVDGQQAYVEQAQLVFEAKGIDPARYRFEQGNVLEHELGENFDLVLCLGVMDRIAKPVELFERISGAGAELVVIDTEVSRARPSLFEVSTLYDTTDVMGYPLVLIPSREALAELAGQLGFETVALALNVTDFTGMADYRRERRLAFICSKGPSLEGVPAQPPAPGVPWWLRKPGALLSS